MTSDNPIAQVRSATHPLAPSRAGFPAVLLGGVAAFVSGWAIVMWGADDCHVHAPSLVAGDVYQGWAVLVGLTFTTAWFGFVALVAALVRLWGRFGRRSKHSVTGLVLLVYLAVAIVPGFVLEALRATGGQAFPDTLCDFGTRTTVIVTVGSLLVVPGIIVLDVIRQSAPGSITESDPTHFLELSRVLDRTMVALGGVFTVALVGTAGLRSVVLEAGGSYGKIRLILFGFQFTGLLLVLYWPAKAALNHEACRVRDDLQPLPILSDPALRDKNETRSAIDIMLGAGTTPLQGFQARLLIAAPLITSLIGSIVTGG